MKTIEYKKCAWCGEQYIPHHGNQKYCSKDCYKAAKLKRDRERKKVVSRSKKSLTTPAKNEFHALTKANDQDQMSQFTLALQQVFEPLFFSLNQRLVETNQRIQAIEDMQDEMFFTFYQSPEFQQQMKRQQYEIAEAKRLIIQHEKRLLLSQIRIIIEEKFQISKRVAEGILKKAHIQLRHERNNSQRSLDDWEERT